MTNCKFRTLRVIMSDKISTGDRVKERTAVLFYQMEHGICRVMKFGRIRVTEKPFAERTGTPDELLHPLFDACAIQSFINPSIARIPFRACVFVTTTLTLNPISMPLSPFSLGTTLPPPSIIEAMYGCSKVRMHS